MPGGSNSMQPVQTQTASAAPWDKAQPYLLGGMNAAQSLFNSGVGAEPFRGSTVVPFSKQTMQGMDWLESGAPTAQNIFSANFGQVADNAAQGGLNQFQAEAAGLMRPMASGDRLVNDNPFMQAVVNPAVERAANEANLVASGAGRYGSTANQQAVARTTGEVAANLLNQNYATERGYQQDAIGSLFNIGQQQQQNINANTGALGEAFSATGAPASRLFDVGSQYEDLATRQLNDELRVFRESQLNPWEQVSRLLGAAQGVGGLGSTTTSTLSAQGPSGFQQGIGGLATLGGLAGLFL